VTEKLAAEGKQVTPENVLALTGIKTRKMLKSHHVRAFSRQAGG
jgi:hypothetical protein